MNAVKWAAVLLAVPVVFAISCTVTFVLCVDHERRAMAAARRARAA